MLPSATCGARGGGITEADSIGIGSNVWFDPTDMHPTILELAGLNDDHVHDGRAISEILEGYAVLRFWRKARASSLSRKCTSSCTRHSGLLPWPRSRFPARSWLRTTRTTAPTTRRLRAELKFKADEKLGYPGPPGSPFYRTWKPTVEAHQAALRAASAPTGFPYVNRFRW